MAVQTPTRLLQNAAAHEMPHVSELVRSSRQGNPLGTASGVLGAVSLFAWGNSLFSAVLGAIAPKVPFISGALSKTAQVASLPNVEISRLGEAVSEVAGRHSAITRTVEHTGNAIASLAQKTLGSHADGLKGKSAFTILSSASFTAKGINSLLNTGLGRKMATLKQMQLDITGKEASTWAIVTGGGLHPLVSHARHEAFGMTATLSNIAKLAEVGYSLYTLFSNDSTAKTGGNREFFKPKSSNPLLTHASNLGNKAYGMFASPEAKHLAINMALSNIPGMLTSGHTALDAIYDAHHRQAAGVEIPPEIYAHIINGTVKNIKHSVVIDMAEQFHARQSSPAETLQILAEQFHKKDYIFGDATAKYATRNNARSRDMALTG